MAIDSIAIKIEVLAVSSGSGPLKMLPGSLVTSFMVSYALTLEVSDQVDVPRQLRDWYAPFVANDLKGMQDWVLSMEKVF